MAMVRVNFSLTEKHRKKLQEEAENEGIRASEMLRRIMDFYFERRQK